MTDRGGPTVRRRLVWGWGIIALIGLVAPQGPSRASAQIAVDSASGDSSGPQAWSLLMTRPGVVAAKERVGDVWDGQAEVGGKPFSTPPSGDIDWSDPDGRGRSYQRLVHGHMLVRDLAALARAGTPDATQLAVSIIADWVADNPRSNPAHPMAWHDETTALRTLSWVDLYELLPQESRTRLRELLRQHALVLLDDDFHTTGTNHGMHQDRALLAWALSPAATPDIRDTAFATATRRLLDYFQAAVGVDGVHLEHSPAYHQSMAIHLGRFVRVYEAVDQPGAADALRRVRASMEAYSTHVLQPDGTWPLVSDTGLDTTPDKTLLEPDNTLFESDTYRFAVSGGGIGQAPGETDAFFPATGYAIMRSGWSGESNSTYMHFSAAYNGNYHKHADDLSVWIYHDGELLTEAGANGYEYSDPFTAYGYSALSHNVVLVDGVGVPRIDGQTTEVELLDFGRTGTTSHASGRSGRLPSADWTRALRYSRDDSLVTVTDRVESATGPRTWEVRWHTAPEIVAAVDDAGRVILSRGGLVSASLTVEALGMRVRPSLLQGRVENPMAGWRLGKDGPTPTTTLSFMPALDAPSLTMTSEIQLHPRPPQAPHLPRPCRNSAEATSTPTHFHDSALACMNDTGIMPATDTRLLGEPRPITRGEFAEYVVKLLDALTVLPPLSGAPVTFLDVEEGEHADAISRASAVGIVTGYNAERFAPDSPITRAQAASILARAWTVTNSPPLPDGPRVFVDEEPPTHAESIRRTARLGIVGGDGRLGFRPHAFLSRGQAATVLARFWTLAADQSNSTEAEESLA